MKCAECNCWWQDEGMTSPSCHADPNWPAPCEYEDDGEEYEYHYTYEDLGPKWY